MMHDGHACEHVSTSHAVHKMHWPCVCGRDIIDMYEARDTAGTQCNMLLHIRVLFDKRMIIICTTRFSVSRILRHSPAALLAKVKY